MPPHYHFSSSELRKSHVEGLTPLAYLIYFFLPLRVGIFWPKPKPDIDLKMKGCFKGRRNFLVRQLIGYN